MLTEIIRKKYFIKNINLFRDYIHLRKPTVKELLWIKLSWFNPGFTASVGYLLKMIDLYMECNGSILECGTGISTVLGSIIAKKKNLEMISLEHRDDSYQHMLHTLSELKINNFNVFKSPLKNHGDFEWYDLDGISPRNVGLVICDGPPWHTKGGRYGLMPLMMPYFNNGCKILLDDTYRRSENRIISKWNKIVGIDYDIQGFPFSFAEIRLKTNS